MSPTRTPTLLRRALVAAPLLTLPFPALARQAAGPIVVPIKLNPQRILVDVTLAGRGPFPFVVDTGAAFSGILDALARQLGLKEQGRVRLGGGGGEDNYSTYAATDVVVGGAYRQDAMLVAGMPERVVLGGDGLLSGVMTKVDAELDSVAGVIRLYPKGGADRTGFSTVDSSLHAPTPGLARMIYVDAQLNGRTLRLLVDTGAPNGLVLSPTAAAASGLWDDTRAYAPAALKGIGGAKRLHGRTVRGQRLTLGPAVFDRPLVTLNNPGYGRGYSGHDGILGLPFIRQVTLATETAGGRVLIKPAGQPRPPEVYNRAGIWLDEAGDRLVVGDVGPGSPAAEAGVKVGEKLKAGATLGEATRGFTRQPGATVVVPLERGDVAFTLKDYL